MAAVQIPWGYDTSRIYGKGMIFSKTSLANECHYQKNFNMGVKSQSRNERRKRGTSRGNMAILIAVAAAYGKTGK